MFYIKRVSAYKNRQSSSEIKSGNSSTNLLCRHAVWMIVEYDKSVHDEGDSIRVKYEIYEKKKSIKINREKSIKIENFQLEN